MFLLLLGIYSQVYYCNTTFTVFYNVYMVTGIHDNMTGDTKPGTGHADLPTIKTCMTCNFHFYYDDASSHSY